MNLVVMSLKGASAPSHPSHVSKVSNTSEVSSASNASQNCAKVVPVAALPSAQAGSIDPTTLLNFLAYFVEQSIALLGTWAQQLALGWFAHGALQFLPAMSSLRPEGPFLTGFFSALTWIVLTAWTFKLRERFRSIFASLLRLKSNVSSANRLSLVHWAKKGHCC